LKPAATTVTIALRATTLRTTDADHAAAKGVGKTLEGHFGN
jgi:hypothetical protein